MGKQGKAGKNSSKSHHRQSPVQACSSSKKNHHKKDRDYHGGDCDDFDDLVAQVRPLGLGVRRMAMDGNCLFRAFADQLDGDAEEHMYFRTECIDHIEANREDFEVFYADEDEEDGETFDRYLQRMRSFGVWGSQMELTALCQRFKVNAIIHQVGSRAWEMELVPRDARCIQLSYHDGMHYNSVRLVSDMFTNKGARCVTLRQLRPDPSGDPSKEPEAVRQLRELLPPDFEVTTEALYAALAAAEDNVDDAAEALLAAEAGDPSAINPVVAPTATLTAKTDKRSSETGTAADDKNPDEEKDENGQGKSMSSTAPINESEEPLSPPSAEKEDCASGNIGDSKEATSNDNAKQSRAEKRAERKKQKQAAKDDKKQKKLRQKVAAAGSSDESDANDEDAAMARLSRQLVAV